MGSILQGLCGDAFPSPSKSVNFSQAKYMFFAFLRCSHYKEPVTAGVGQKAAGMRALLALALFGACIGTITAAGKLIMAPRAARGPASGPAPEPASLLLSCPHHSSLFHAASNKQIDTIRPSSCYAGPGTSLICCCQTRSDLLFSFRLLQSSGWMGTVWRQEQLQWRPQQVW